MDPSSSQIQVDCVDNQCLHHYPLRATPIPAYDDKNICKRVANEMLGGIKSWGGLHNARREGLSDPRIAMTDWNELQGKHMM